MWYMKDYYFNLLSNKTEEELVEFWFELDKNRDESYASYLEANETFN